MTLALMASPKNQQPAAAQAAVERRGGRGLRAPRIARQGNGPSPQLAPLAPAQKLRKHSSPAKKASAAANAVAACAEGGAARAEPPPGKASGTGGSIRALEQPAAARLPLVCELQHDDDGREEDAD